MWTCCLTELGKRTFIVPSRGKQMQQLPWKGWYTDPPENARLFPWYRSYCWWFRNPLNSPVELGSLSHYLQVLLLHPRWVPRFFPSTVPSTGRNQCVNGHLFQSYPKSIPNKKPHQTSAKTPKPNICPPKKTPRVRFPCQPFSSPFQDSMD